MFKSSATMRDGDETHTQHVNTKQHNYTITSTIKILKLGVKLGLSLWTENGD
jgi:hypothetical protein